MTARPPNFFKNLPKRPKGMPKWMWARMALSLKPRVRNSGLQYFADEFELRREAFGLKAAKAWAAREALDKTYQALPLPVRIVAWPLKKAARFLLFLPA